MLPALLAGKLLRIPVVGHYRAPERTDGAAALYARAVDQWISVSETMARRLRAAGVEPARLKVVHDAMDLGAFEPGDADPRLRQTLGIPAEAPIVGIFGRIIQWKGIREFVEAVAMVMVKRPEARALIVGDPSDGGEEYFREVQDLVKSSPSATEWSSPASGRMSGS